MFRPLRDINRLRQDKECMAILRRSFEVFSLPVDIEFPKTLHQWEKNSNYWEAAYASQNSAVGPASTTAFSARNSVSSPAPAAPSTTVNMSTRQGKKAVQEEKDGEGFFANCVCYSDKVAKAKNGVVEQKAVEPVILVTPAVTSSDVKPMNPDDVAEPFVESSFPVILDR